MSWKHPHKLLSLYIDGELSRSRQERLEQHLSGCPDCRQLLRRLRLVKSAVNEIPVPETPTYLAARIAARLSRHQEAPSFWGSFSLVPRLLQPVALLLIVLITVFLVWSNGPNSAEEQAIRTYMTAMEEEVTFTALGSDDEALQFALMEQQAPRQGENK